MAFSSVFINPFRGPFGDPAAAAVDFADTLVNTYGASEVWKLTDITSGTTIPAYVNSARNGVLQGWTLQNSASPVVEDAGFAPFSDGTNDYGNLLTSSFQSLFNGDEGSLIAFVKFNGVSWSDGATRRLFQLTAGANEIVMNKNTAGGVVISRTATSLKTVTQSNPNTSNWCMVASTWSVSNNRFRGYFNGSQVGTTQTGLSAWSGGSPTRVLIGASATNPFAVWHGWHAWYVWFTSEKSAADITAIYTDAIS